ncbi:MAG: hypothetical protein ABI680_11900 [Chthoniobacteraceae bacterium]
MTEDRLLVTFDEAHARPPRKWWIRLGRGLLCFAIFASAMVVVAQFIGRIHRFGGIIELREKMAWWDQHADEYNTLFLGTSRVYRGLMPRIIDQRMAEAGRPTKTFNFGIDGMFAPEDSYVIEHILDRQPKHLRWVFIELAMFQKNIDTDDPFTVRNSYWHDGARTMLVIRNLLTSKNGEIRWKELLFGTEGERKRLRYAWGHLTLYISHTLSIGHGRRLLEADFNPLGKMKGMRILGPDRDGFEAMGPDKILAGPDLKSYEAQLKKLMGEEQRAQLVNPQLQRNLEVMVRRVRELGATPIFIIAPVLNREIRLPGGALADVPVLNFSNLVNSRQLLETKYRADSAHLTPEGAVLFSEEFARRFIDLLRSQSPPR